MNSKRNYRTRTATFATVVACIACAATSAPAFAEHPRGDAGNGEATARTSYADPVAAFGGISFAQYIADHEAADPRTHTVV